jgi:hypothetical protein
MLVDNVHACLGNGASTPAGIETPTRTHTHMGAPPVIPRDGAQQIHCFLWDAWVDRVNTDLLVLRKLYVLTVL